MIKRNNHNIPASCLVLAVLALILSACGEEEPVRRPKNVILMIGDGMGIAHIHAAMIANGGRLNLENAQYTGFQKTHSSNADITDSGASATAMACGVKTRNGAIGVDSLGKPVKTILELAEEEGLATGLLATSTITHATPAAFAAHTPDRGRYEDIAMDLSRAGIEFIMGGGRHHFNRREDGIDLLEEMRAGGYAIFDDIADLPGQTGDYVAILADTLALPSVAAGRGELLVKATSLALEHLSKDPEGFFMMVEGSQIDWAAHAGNTESIIWETIDFDRAVGRALEWAGNDGQTLVIITADHETGGFSVLGGGPHNPRVEGAFSTDGHTGVMVPVFAYGPGAEEFSGIYENTGIFTRMKQLLNL